MKPRYQIAVDAITLLGTFALMSLTLSACFHVREEATFVENAAWHHDELRVGGLVRGSARVVLPAAIITVQQQWSSSLQDLALAVVFTQQQPGLTFRPFDLRLDGRAPDKFSTTGFWGTEHRLEPGAEVPLSDCADCNIFRCRFENIENIAALPTEASSTAERKFTLSFERGLAANGRTIIVPPLALDVKWTGTRELPSCGSACQENTLLRLLK